MCLVLAVFAATCPCIAQMRDPGQAASGSDHAVETHTVHGDYIRALATADAFLDAWRMRDIAKARTFLSEGALRRYRPGDALDLYLGGPSNPHHAAFTIWNGRHLGKRRIAFSVLLYHDYTAQPWTETWIGGPATILLIQTGPWEWKVDRLPDWPRPIGKKTKK